MEGHLWHAAGFAAALNGGRVRVEARAADLGSGAGLPGLPLALRFPQWQWTLIDAAARRCAFLRDAVRALGLDGRVSVVEERAEILGRSPEYRSRYDVVVARSFGPPAVVAECAAPLLIPGGTAVISEPPGGAPWRWPAEGLALLGLLVGAQVRADDGTFQTLGQDELCSDRYPRRVGVPVKRPLF